MNGLKGEKGDPVDVSSVLGLRVSTAAVPPGLLAQQGRGHTLRVSLGTRIPLAKGTCLPLSGTGCPSGAGHGPGVPRATGTVHFAGP